MYDATAVGVGERARAVTQDANGIGDRQRPFPLQARSQTLTLYVRHREVERALRQRTCGEERHDVEVPQAGRQLYLTLEPLGAEALGEVSPQYFDNDFAAERHVVGDEHVRHTATAEL